MFRATGRPLGAVKFGSISAKDVVDVAEKSEARPARPQGVAGARGRASFALLPLPSRKVRFAAIVLGEEAVLFGTKYDLARGLGPLCFR
jgi:hypothetical protein